MSLDSKETDMMAQHTGRKDSKLWTKSYILTLFSIFVISITMTLFMPLLPIYIKMVGGNISLAGLVVSVYTLAALISRPFFAVVIDKYGRKPILISGFALIIIGCFAYRFITVIGILILFRVVHGIGYSAGSNAAGTIMSDVVPKERRAQGVGYYGFVTAASLALGPAFGLTIMKSTDVKTAFTVAAVLAAFGFIASFFVSYEKKDDIKGLGKSGNNESVKPETKKKFNIGYEKTAMPAALVMIFIAFAYAGIVTFLAAHMGQLGLEEISLFFIIYAVVLLITRLVVDKITKSREISVVLIPGIVLMMAGFLLLATGKAMPVFLCAAVLYAIGYGAVQPTLYAISISSCEPRRRGAANSTFFSAMDLGIGLGALAWGFVSQRFGYSAIYFTSIVFMVLSAIAVISLLRKKAI